MGALAQGQAQGQGSQNIPSSANCTDPLAQGCSSATSLQQGSAQQGAITADMLQNSSRSSLEALLGQKADQSGQVYIDQAGNTQNRSASATQGRAFPPDRITDMQRLAQASTGELLPVFGRDLFQQSPSTFAPADQIPALNDYVVGPGDVILLRLWGPEAFNGQLTVDSSGSIYVPQVGAIHVAGLSVDQLQSHISADLKHTFRNFNLSVNLGHLRSIQVYVVGEARRPGAYTVSSLSTLLNVLLVSGGPSVQGSLRHIQVRRQGAPVGELDLYNLILLGDRTQDIRLQSGDTIFIPAVGPQAALAGSVNHPAIYELRDGSTVDSLLKIAGGLTPVALRTQLSLERIDDQHGRTAMTVRLDSAGGLTPLRDGDILFANHITSAFQKSVTIRGNLANPGRFPWHPGMRLSEIIPDRMSLLTNDYWQQRNRLGVPIPLFEPIRSMQQQQPMSDNRGRDAGQTYPSAGMNPSPDRQDADALVPAFTSTDGADAAYMARRRQQNAAQAGLAESSDSTLTRGSLAEEQQAAANLNVATTGKRTVIQIPAPEIDWSYAVIERLDPNTLKNSLVPFNLGKLLQDHDPSQNLELQPGDVVTILSQADVHVPQDQQTKFIRLEGEFVGAGVYSVQPEETLYDVVQRAGGLSSKAYLYGASFTRESARVFQQQRLDEYIDSVAINMQRDAAVRVASSSNGIGDPNALQEQREVIAQLRKLRATGRIVLEFQPESAGAGSIPRIPLEDGDVFRISSRPLTVNVIGAVYGQNTFLYDSRRRVEDYLLLAGKPTRIADRQNEFIIRADGSVYSHERAQSPWKNSFDATQINPGDSIIIPEKPVRPNLARQVIDYSQIFSQFALGAAALAVIKSN